jgi:CheY-like chemotaxis protein
MSVLDQTILLAEDNPDDVFLIQRAFRKANLACPMQVVEDGEAAVAYLTGQGSYIDRNFHPLPGLMLLDLKMPRKSGLEILEWVRQQPGLKRLPIVVLTSSKESTDINRAYDLGVNSYLIKPVSFDALLEMVKTLGLYWMTFNQRPVT